MTFNGSSSIKSTNCVMRSTGWGISSLGYARYVWLRYERKNKDTHTHKIIGGNGHTVSFFASF